MPQNKIVLPLPDEEKCPATLVYITKTQHGEAVDYCLHYLHRVRDPKWLLQCPTYAAGSDALSYYLQLPNAIQAFEHEIRAFEQEFKGDKFELFLSPPSRRQDAAPYLAAAKKNVLDPTDLSRFFFKVADVQVGTFNNPFNNPLEAIRTIAFTYGGRLDDRKNVLIVDDVFARGSTAAALVFRMRQLGLPHAASVTVAAPLFAAPLTSAPLGVAGLAPQKLSR